MPFDAYISTLVAVTCLAALMMLQLVAVDVISILRKHTPGMPVATGHDDLLFRATRTVANMNESLGLFIVVLLLCLIAGADPGYTATATWTYVASRALYAVCYYANWQTPRSIVFGLSLLAVTALLVLAATTIV